MSALYYNLVRCSAIVEKHEGSTLENLYERARRSRIPELKHWKLKDYFQKMIDDGVIYEKEKDHYYLTPEEAI